MFHWLTDHRRQKLLSQPFPPEWEAHIARNMAHWHFLDEAERDHLCALIKVFAHEKSWHGAGGLEMTDEIRATVSAQACLLLLGLDRLAYDDVETIIVYPSTVLTPPRPDPIFPSMMIVDDGGVAILGEAVERGPVLLVWDSVRRGGIHPEKGHNVVYHEFAHKLDMLGGGIDGTPPLSSRGALQEWIVVCQREFDELKRRAERGEPTFLDAYGATNVGEFFAVATEHFFDQPLALLARHPDLYRVLARFYRQEPAEREQRFREAQATAAS